MQSDLMRPFALINNGLLFVNTYYVYMFLFLFCNVKVNPKAEWNVIEAQISVRVVAAISENFLAAEKAATHGGDTRCRLQLVSCLLCNSFVFGSFPLFAERMRGPMCFPPF